MKTKKWITLLLLISGFIGNAQSHSTKADDYCKLKGKRGNQLGYCDACYAEDQKIAAAKLAEVKRNNEKIWADAQLKKEALEREREAKRLKDAKEAKSGEVVINMPSSNTTSTTTKPVDNYDAKTGTYTNPLTTYNSSATTEFQKNYETGQQIGQLANDVVDIFSKSPERLAREEAQRTANAAAYQNRIKEELAEDNKKFRANYMHLMDKAKKGDENTRMILYFASGRLYSRRDVPEREKWLYQAFNNKNTDAYLEVANLELEKNKNQSEYWSYINHAATLGSVDAMVKLAIYNDYTKKLGGNENAALALEWFEKAAEKGSPNAMYYLGMIYKYGITEDLNDGFGIKNIRRKMHVKYNVELNEKTALYWFEKSIQPEYVPSIYAKEKNSFGRYSHNITSYFIKNSYKELSLFYKEGKVVQKDKAKAKELIALFEGTTKS